MTAVTVMVKVCDAEVSIPPLAVPPLSCTVTVKSELPVAFAAGVKLSVPSVPMLGPALNKAALLTPDTV